jgi:PAS domain S-box-containing protein
MKTSLSRATLAVAGTGLLLAFGTVVAIKRIWPRVDDRVYVIGWQNSPPFQLKAPDGSPAGLAVDLVRDAARRRGIRLKWVWYPAGPDAALRSQHVDLWPLTTITPERQAVIHISQPYLQHDHDLLVRARSGYSQIEDLASASISYIGTPINQRSLNSLLPHARRVTVASGEDAIENVCEGQTDAAYLDEFSAGAVLLSAPTHCSSEGLRVITVPRLKTLLGVGSTLEASAVADEIRRGIDATVLDGDLSDILKSGGYLSARNVQYFTAFLEARRDKKWLTAAVLFSVFLLGLASFAGDRIRRETNRIRVTEEGLRQSERRFRGLLEQIRLVAVMTDLNGTINFWNDYAEAITGWSQAEVLGRPVNEFLRVSSAGPETDEIPRWPPLEGTQPFCEGRILLKNGGQRCVEWTRTPIHDSAGRLVGYASLGEDVTELHALRAEAARIESEEQFRRVADTAPLMIWTAGPEMRCTFVNKAWLEFSGLTLEQELGDGWTANVHPDDLEYGRAICTAAWEICRNVQFEYRMRRADGEYRWMLFSGLPRFGPDGQCLGYIGTCTDITELKVSRDEDTARQKLETVGRLAGGIAHDFNNLLGGVLAQAELGLIEVSAGVLPEDELNTIRDVATRGAGIVRQLMIYAGQEAAVSEPVDLSSLIDDMRDLLKVVVSKHVVLKTELGRDLAAVQANPAQLRQVVLNLVTNASEAIGEIDGIIVIRTNQKDAKSDLSRQEKKSERLVLEVEDTGCGISCDIQPKLFEPFFTTKSAGHGLGLAVVLRIVKELGGAIQVESQPGRGARFRILLPCSSEIVVPLRLASVLSQKFVE